MKSVFEKIANSKSTNAHSSGGDKNKVFLLFLFINDMFFTNLKNIFLLI